MDIPVQVGELVRDGDNRYWRLNLEGEFFEVKCTRARGEYIVKGRRKPEEMVLPLARATWAGVLS